MFRDISASCSVVGTPGQALGSNAVIKDWFGFGFAASEDQRIPHWYISNDQSWEQRALHHRLPSSPSTDSLSSTFCAGRPPVPVKTDLKPQQKKLALIIRNGFVLMSVLQTLIFN